MFRISALAVLAVSVAEANEGSVRVAVLGLSGSGVAAETLSFEGEHLAQSLRAPGLNVVTAREMSALLGLERQRQLMGCDPSSSACIAELAGALGAEVVVVGDVGRFDGTHQVNVKALSGRDAHVIVSKSARVSSDVAELDALTAVGHALAAAVLSDSHQPVPPELTRTPSGSRLWGLLPLSLAVAAGAGGAVLMVLARQDAAALTGSGPPLTSAVADALRDSGRAKQAAGVVLLSASGAALVTAVALLAFGSDVVVLSLAPQPGGWQLALRGRLP